MNGYQTNLPFSNKQKQKLVTSHCTEFGLAFVFYGSALLICIYKYIYTLFV